jgi:hypothetical protein
MNEEKPPEEVAAPLVEPKPARTDEQRAADRERQRKSRAGRAAATNSKAWSPLADSVPAKPEALEILEERIQNAHVRDVAYEQGTIAADRLEIPANRFYWRYGLQETLRAIEFLNHAKKQFEFVAGEIKAGRLQPPAEGRNPG